MAKETIYLRAAICDAEKKNLNWMAEMFARMGEQENIKITTDIMRLGTKLIKKMVDKEHYDIVCLCIDQEEDFRKTAEILRGLDQEITFFFLSKDDAKIKQIYEFCPAAYLEYPLQEDEFTKCFLRTVERFMDRRRYLVFNFDRQTYHIRYDTIQYMETQGHNIEIRTEGGEYRISGKLDDIQEKLDQACPMFIRTHKSYIVNYKYIRLVQAKVVELMQGQQIPVSTTFRQNLKGKYCEYTQKINWRLHGNA
ncbi:MAG: LytTR family DNA-binding domain-containing protein [Lachnospiraceae bacterium]|nr:LytTR family DNA-binding domain-containing protein [Lachnospiraceae bacterium]